jgi:malate dehydrogenase (quinone)
MLDVVERIYAAEFQSWQPEIKKLVPSFGVDLNADAQRATTSLSRTAATLKLKA